MARRRAGAGNRIVRLAFAAAVVVVALLVGREVTGGGATGEAAPRVVIPRGASVRSVADSLASQGVIGSARLFRWYVSAAGQARAIKPGAYQFADGAGYATILDALVNGRGIVRTVVIPEGFDQRDITPALAKGLGVSEDSVRAALADTALQRTLDLPIPSLEGYLFPATYSFADGTSAREAVQSMVDRFLESWKPEWDARLTAMSISRHDAITMASIVEKEARKPAERPLIAAVYWNRVKQGMRLQADPTVQYALPQHVGRVLYKDLEIESKFNTYQHEGLPPGPIASPGEASIAAALAPADVPYLFFVARPDGSHEFTTSFGDHSQAIGVIRSAAKREAAKRDAAKKDSAKKDTKRPARPAGAR